VTLEDLYNGKTTKLAVQRNVICSDCEGIGGKKVSLHEVYAQVLLPNRVLQTPEGMPMGTE